MAVRPEADMASFPEQPPANLDEPAAVAAHDQLAFDTLLKMTDHWSRPAWPDGASAYYWLLALGSDQALRQSVLECQRHLEPFDLDPVPADWLHVTLTKAAGASPSQTQLLRALDTAAELVPPAFTIEAVPLAGSRGAVRFSLGPWTPLLDLHAALTTASSRAGVSGGRPTAAFRPHLSLAYSNRPQSAAVVIEAVQRLRQLPAIELHITDVQLVHLYRTGREYRWTVLDTLSLPPANPQRF